jgi:hypothetical protein
VINTEENEETPFPSDDGYRLFFSSEGHFNMGGFDVFYSEITGDGTWTDPVNIGFPINTTGDDLFFYPIGDGTKGFMSRIEREEAHAYNIYRVSIGERRIEFTDSSGETGFPEDFNLLLIHTVSGDTLTIQYSKEKDLFRLDDPVYKIIREE